MLHLIVESQMAKEMESGAISRGPIGFQSSPAFDFQMGFRVWGSELGLYLDTIVCRIKVFVTTLLLYWVLCLHFPYFWGPGRWRGLLVGSYYLQGQGDVVSRLIMGIRTWGYDMAYAGH